MSILFAKKEEITPAEVPVAADAVPVKEEVASADAVPAKEEVAPAEVASVKEEAVSAEAAPAKEDVSAPHKGPEDPLIGRRTMAARNISDGDAAQESGDAEAAYTAYKKGAEIYEEIVAMGGGSAEDRAALAKSYKLLGKLSYQLNVHYTELSAEAMRNMAAYGDDPEKQAQYQVLIEKHGKTAKHYLAATGQYDRKLRELKT